MLSFTEGLLLRKLLGLNLAYKMRYNTLTYKLEHNLVKFVSFDTLYLVQLRLGQCLSANAVSSLAPEMRGQNYPNNPNSVYQPPTGY